MFNSDGSVRNDANWSKLDLPSTKYLKNMYTDGTTPADRGASVGAPRSGLSSAAGANNNIPHTTTRNIDGSVSITFPTPLENAGTVTISAEEASGKTDEELVEIAMRKEPIKQNKPELPNINSIIDKYMTPKTEGYFET